MPASKAQQKAVTKYMKAKYDEIKVRVEKGQKDTIQAHAEARNESVNGFIGRAISETMERDSGGIPSETAGKRPESEQMAGVVSLPSDTLEAAQKAAEATGEGLPDFVRRAVETQAQRDQASLKLGINPITREKQQ